MFGSCIQNELEIHSHPKRKETLSKTLQKRYEFEYGADCLEMHADAIKKGEKVVLVDDLLTTAVTAKAAETLLTRCGSKVVGAGFLIERNAHKD